MWVVQSFAGGGGSSESSESNGGQLDYNLAGLPDLTAEEREEEMASLAACQAYPNAFLRPTGDDNHDRVVQFLSERDRQKDERKKDGRGMNQPPSIFCLPPPKLAVAERNLPRVPIGSLDSSYRRQVRTVVGLLFPFARPDELHFSL